VPCGAVGGTDEVMAAISDGRHDRLGTFNCNPLTTAATRAVLHGVLSRDTHATAEALNREMFDGCFEALGDNNGVFLAPWAKSESWTLSVAHTSADGERLIENTHRLRSLLAAISDEASDLFEVGAIT
jgi:glutamate-1-semialdehyde aminotransferase